MTLQLASLQRSSSTKRSAIRSDSYARLLDQVAKVEASLTRTRKQLLEALELEMESLTHLRCELLRAKTEETSGLPEERGAVSLTVIEGSEKMLTDPPMNMVNFPLSRLKEAQVDKLMHEAHVHPVLERASVEDLSNALAAAFNYSPEKV